MTSLSEIPVGKVLPQQPPFRFVSGLVSYSQDRMTVFFVVGDCLLLEDGHLTAEGIIEHAAQSCAAFIGYVSLFIKKEPVRIGFLGQVRKLTLGRLPAVGERLDTKVTILQEVFGIALCDVTVCAGEEVIAHATLKNALKDD